MREAGEKEKERERLPSPSLMPHLREVGSLATWILSSAKSGFGVEQLRDQNHETYWQSDGAQPHTITIQLPRKMEIHSVAMYLNYTLDESYTPSRVAVRVGTGLHDLHEALLTDLHEPRGWTMMPLRVRANLVQVAVLANHQNGRDSHVREVLVFALRKTPAQLLRQPAFDNPDVAQYSQLR